MNVKVLFMRAIRILISVMCLSLIFTSCKKDRLLTIYGQWVLVDGYMYSENMRTGEITKYNHFDVNKVKSQLSGFNKPSFDIDVIEKDKTTWEFQRNGDFILNDQYDKPLYINISGCNVTIIEHPTSGIIQIGGSARPIIVYTNDYKKKIMKVKTRGEVGSYKGDNVEWYNELYFKKISDN